MAVAARVVVVHSLLGPVAEKKLLGRGIRALCPMYSREVRHARRTVVKSYPLYSCYMFAWIDDDQLRLVLNVAECVDVLRKAGSPRELSVVPDHVISAISHVPEMQSFERGEELTVQHGRWEGLRGLYSHSEEERVILLFQMLGQQVPIPFHRTEVSKTLLAGSGR